MAEPVNKRSERSERMEAILWLLFNIDVEKQETFTSDEIRMIKLAEPKIYVSPGKINVEPAIKLITHLLRPCINYDEARINVTYTHDTADHKYGDKEFDIEKIIAKYSSSGSEITNIPRTQRINYVIDLLRKLISSLPAKLDMSEREMIIIMFHYMNCMEKSKSYSSIIDDIHRHLINQLCSLVSESTGTYDIHTEYEENIFERTYTTMFLLDSWHRHVLLLTSYENSLIDIYIRESND
jgi:hypothetical protein